MIFAILLELHAATTRAFMLLRYQITSLPLFSLHAEPPPPRCCCLRYATLSQERYYAS